MYRALRIVTLRPYLMSAQRYSAPLQPIHRYLSMRPITSIHFNKVNNHIQHIQRLQMVRQLCTEAPASKTPQKPLTKMEQLKKAFKDYGSTIIIFHIGISLISLGGFYSLVSSGLDVIALLEKLGIPPDTFGKMGAGASTFVVAFAIHKVFAPVRVSITLFSTPFIVKALRARGIIKAPPVKPKTPETK